MHFRRTSKFTYENDLNEVVYYNFFNKNFHLIPKNKLFQFRLFKLRYVCVALIMFFVFIFFKSWQISIGLGAVFAISFESIFRFYFLNKAKILKGFNKSNYSLSEEDKNKNYLIIILMVISIILLIVNGYVESYSDNYFIVSVLISVMALIRIFLSLVVVIRK